MVITNEASPEINLIGASIAGSKATTLGAVKFFDE